MTTTTTSKEHYSRLLSSPFRSGSTICICACLEVITVADYEVLRCTASFFDDRTHSQWVNVTDARTSSLLSLYHFGGAADFKTDADHAQFLLLRACYESVGELLSDVYGMSVFLSPRLGTRGIPGADRLRTHIYNQGSHLLRVVQSMLH